MAGALVGLRDLGDLVRDPVLAARPARRRAWPVVARLLGAGPLVAAAVALALLATAGQVQLVPALVVGAIALAACDRLIMAPPRRNRRDPHLAEVGVVIPDPMAPILEAMRRTAAPAPPSRRRRRDGDQPRPPAPRATNPCATRGRATRTTQPGSATTAGPR